MMNGENNYNYKYDIAPIMFNLFLGMTSVVLTFLTYFIS